MSVVGPMQEFARALRAVRGEAYSVDLSELARRAGVDEAVLTAALAGTAVPPLDATLAFVRACGGSADGWEDRWRAASAARVAPALPANPPRVGQRPPQAPPTTVVRSVDVPAPDHQYAAGPAPRTQPSAAATAEHRSWPGDSDRNARRPLESEDPRSIGGYVLRARLGAGGMGRVYLSATPGGRPVALKVIKSEFAEDPEFRRRFQHEVAAAQRVQGLYTAPVIDAGPHAPQPWLATAYVPGLNLHEAVVRHGALPAETVVLLVAGVAEALQTIHAAGVVHRDLKPSNVILAPDGPRVIDFGIARATDASSVTQSGISIGTPAYMAPEQIEGGPTTPATDMFALGSLAVYAATAALPFGEAGGTTGMIHRIVNKDPDLSACPEPVHRIAAQLLAKAPAERLTPAQVIELCRTASGDSRLRVATGWLPATVAADGEDRENGSLPPLPPDPQAVAKRRRARLAALMIALVLVAGAGVAYGLAASRGDDTPRVTGATTPPASTGPQEGANSPVATPGTAGPTPPPSRAPVSNGPTAGGIAEGGLISQTEFDVPNGYCIDVMSTEPFSASTCYPGNAGAVWLHDDVEGSQLVLLNPGATVDFHECSTNTQYVKDGRIPYSSLKAGSVICFRSRPNQIVGAIRIDAMPDPSAISVYWAVTRILWRATNTG